MIRKLMLIVMLVLLLPFSFIGSAVKMTASANKAANAQSETTGYFLQIKLSEVANYSKKDWSLCGPFDKGLKSEMPFKFSMFGKKTDALCDVYVRFNDKLTVKGKTVVSACLNAPWWFGGLGHHLECVLSDTEIQLSKKSYDYIVKMDNPFQYIALGFGTETYTVWPSNVSSAFANSEAECRLTYSLSTLAKTDNPTGDGGFIVTEPNEEPPEGNQGESDNTKPDVLNKNIIEKFKDFCAPIDKFFNLKSGKTFQILSTIIIIVSAVIGLFVFIYILKIINALIRAIKSLKN